MECKTFEPGEMVKTIFGQIKRVVLQDGCMVFLEGEISSWHHPEKLSRVKGETT